jgi:hypothetical protein
MTRLLAQPCLFLILDTIDRFHAVRAHADFRLATLRKFFPVLRTFRIVTVKNARHGYDEKILAEREGFEPSVTLYVLQRFSKPSLSTTQPSLLKARA